MQMQDKIRAKASVKLEESTPACNLHLFTATWGCGRGTAQQISPPKDPLFQSWWGWPQEQAGAFDPADFRKSAKGLQMHKVIAALEGKLSQRDLDYLLEHGWEYQGRKLPTRIPRHPAGTCLDAADTLERQGHGRYVRGFGLLFRSKTPLMHAWVSKDGWHAVDPVWPDPELCSYWGLEGRRHETRLAAMSASIRRAPLFHMPAFAHG